MKSLEKDRNRRYETASALAADVDRFLNNEVVEARPVSRLYRIQKFVRRNRTIVVSTCAVIFALVLWIAFAISKANQLNAALERWRHELEMNALDAALGGTIERAETFIADAREAGASTETIEWLTGLVELSQGQVMNCIRRLENLRQTRGTLKIPAHVTLAMAYMDNGQLPEYYIALEQLRSAVPVEDADFILLGEARWMWDLRGESIDELNEGLRRRDTPVVRALCARAMLLGGICQPDKKLSQELVTNAVKHIGVAEAMAGDLPLVRDISVLVHHGALSVCPAEDRDMHLRLAQEAITSPAKSAIGKLYRAGFLLDHGNINRAIQLFEEATRECDSPAYFLALALFMRSPSMALEEFMDVPFPNPAGPGALGGQAILLALTPGRQSEAIALADRIVTQYTDYDTRIDALCASLLAGDKKVAGKARNLQSTSYANFHHCDKMLAHLAETDDPGKLESVIRNSNGGHVANYVMGVKLLAAGDRAGARKYLELSAKTPILNSSYPLYARAILGQIDKVKNWPEWLPSRERPLPIEIGAEE